MVYRREVLLGRLRERGALCMEVEPVRASLKAAGAESILVCKKERNLV